MKNRPNGALVSNGTRSNMITFHNRYLGGKSYQWFHQINLFEISIYNLIAYLYLIDLKSTTCLKKSIYKLIEKSMSWAQTQNYQHLAGNTGKSQFKTSSGKA